ncbi:MAG: hypothetical protein HONBIEJF_02013 [Fimbriimonadaceae bacterium]|nr:hypothetical protein [Fimbriimonadaceae bacterium]
MGVALLGICALSQAQVSKPAGISVRGGLFFPSNGDAKDEAKNWIGFGVDYKIGNLAFGQDAVGLSTYYSISVDYFGKGDFSSVPVMLNFVQRTDSLYYIAGAGVSFSKAKLSATQRRTGTDFAYVLGLGYDIQKGMTPVFVELRYWGNSEARLAGFGVYAGVRF